MGKRVLALLSDGIYLAASPDEGRSVQQFRKADCHLCPGTDELFREDTLRSALAEVLAGEKPGAVHLILDDSLLEAELVSSITPGSTSMDDQVCRQASGRARQALRSGCGDYRLYRTENSMNAMLYYCLPGRLEQLEQKLKRHGLGILGVEPASAAEIRLLFSKRDELHRRNLLYLKPDRLRTLVVAVVEGNPVLYRMVEGGIDYLLSGDRPLELVSENLSSGDNAESLLSGLQQFGEGFQKLVDQISDTVKGVQIHFQRRRMFDWFHLSGTLSSHEDFSLYLEEYLRLPRLNMEDFPETPLTPARTRGLLSIFAPVWLDGEAES